MQPRWHVGALSASLLLLAIQPLAALNPRTPLQDYGLTQWTPDDGLPHRFVQTLAQTSDGFLWIGTQEGVVRFDGSRFLNLEGTGSAALQPVLSMAAADEGKLLVGGYHGLISVEPASTGYQVNRIVGVGDAPMGSILPGGDGLLWLAGSKRGLQRWKSGRLEQVISAPKKEEFQSHFLHRSRNGQLWLAAAGQGILRFKDGGWITVVPADAVQGIRIIAMLVQDSGTIWLGTAGSGVLKIGAGDRTQIERLPETSGLSVRALTQDRDDNLWIGTTTVGLLRHHDGQTTGWSRDSSLAQQEVWSILEDTSGNLWVGTAEGLFRLREVPISTVGDEIGDAWAVYQHPKTGLWLGGIDDLINYRDDGETHFRTQALGGGRVLALIADPRSNAIWVAPEDAGVIQIDGDAVRPVPGLEALAQQSVRAMFRDSRDRIWIGGFGMTSVYFFTEGKLHAVAGLPGYASHGVSSFAEGPGNTIWIGTFGGGLFRYQDGKMNQLSHADGLSSNVVLALRLDHRGVLWIGTAGGGLNALNGDRIAVLGAQEGLPTNTVLAIGQDTAQRLWLCSNHGVLAVEYQQLSGVLSGRADKVVSTILSRADGMRNTECNGGGQSSIAESGRGRLWFTTARGAIKIDTERVLLGGVAFAPRIDHIAVDGVALDRLPSDGLSTLTQRLEIDFAVASLSAPLQVRLRHRLEGLEDQWVDSEEARNVSYVRLPAGDYEFQLQSSVGGEQWQSAPPLAFTVHRPFVGSPQFWAFLAFLAATTALALYRWRVAELKARNSVLIERHRIAREVHDTLAQGLLGVRLQTELAEGILAESPDRTQLVAEHLARTKDLAERTLNEAHLFIWHMRSARPGELAAEIRTMLKEFNPSGQLHTQVTIADEIPCLQSDRLFHLLRIIREALFNAIAHANATSISISIESVGNAIRLVVRDDGRGFDVSTAFAECNAGMIGMLERSQLLGGELRLESCLGHGSSIIVTLPASGRL